MLLSKNVYCLINLQKNVGKGDIPNNTVPSVPNNTVMEGM